MPIDVEQPQSTAATPLLPALTSTDSTTTTTTMTMTTSAATDSTDEKLQSFAQFPSVQRKRVAPAKYDEDVVDERGAERVRATRSIEIGGDQADSGDIDDDDDWQFRALVEVDAQLLVSRMQTITSRANFQIDKTHTHT